MRYVAAYMLAVMGGNENPTADDIKMIIGSVGIESEDEKLNLVIKKLHGKNIEELVAESQSLLASTVCNSANVQNEPAPVEEKTKETEEKKEDNSDSDDDSEGGLLLLFD